MKRNTVNTLLTIAIIVISAVVIYRVSNDAAVNHFIEERNVICANLSFELSSQEGVDDCFCYYQGFKTGDTTIDSKTLPLCACECGINGTITKIGVLQAN